MIFDSVTGMNKQKTNNKIVLGLSGGVDSAVAAYLLKVQGYDVLGVYLKNWTEKDEKGICPAERDREDAMRVAAKLGIAFSTVDYEKQYRERVFTPFLKGLGKGLNPNPDIMCNPLVKFEALLAVADDIGASLIATGHYARHIKVNPSQRSRLKPELSPRIDSIHQLAVGVDAEKDQSYFLSRITGEQLARTVFPVGELTKPEVRKIAAEIGLSVADKEGTSGICFIGERNFEAFMKDRVPAKPGPVITPDGTVVGEHRGLPFYTVGQRHGFGCPSTRLGTTEESVGGLPYYIAEKRFDSNTIVVARAYDPALFHTKVKAIDQHWITSEPEFPLKCRARIRYRQPLQSCTVKKVDDGSLLLVFDKDQRAVTPGQYAAFYDGDICLGSAVIV